MDDLAQDEQILVTEENIRDLITSKAVKQRMAAYKSVSKFPELIGLPQNETLAIAIEPALSALLSYEGDLTNNEIANFYNQFTQTKPNIRNTMSELINKVFNQDKQGVIHGLLNSCLHKNPKVVSGCVGKLKDLIENNNEYFNTKEGKALILQGICPQMETILSSADKDVKSEGCELAFEIYKIIFDQLNEYIKNIKPIILKELTSLFSTVEIPDREIKITELEFDNPDWKERLAALNYLKEHINHMSNKSDVYLILSRKTKDVNLQVVTAAIETIKNGRIVQPDCIRGSIERFKDKKAPLTALIKETIQTLQPDINILIDYLDNPNPQIKVGVLECLKFYQKISRVKDIAKLLEDSSPDVRKATMAVLEAVEDLEGLTDAQLSKLRKKPMLSKPVVASSSPVLNTKSPILNRSMPVQKPQQIMPQNTVSPKRSSISFTKSTSVPDDVVLMDSSCFEFNMSINEKNNINEEFINRHPYLLEKDWAKKLESINNNVDQIKQESPLSIVYYLIGSKETNFHIFKAFMGILESYADLISIRTPLVSFLNSKITETKLHDNVISLYKKIDKNHDDFITQNFIYCLKANKSGKKFLTFLEVFSLFLKHKSVLVDKFLSDFKVVGAPEKRALQLFIDRYNKLDYDKNVDIRSDTNEKSEAISTLQHKTNPIISNENVEGFSKIVTKSKLEENVKKAGMNGNTIEVLNTNYHKEQADKFISKPTDCFTVEFIELFNRDINTAIKMLEKLYVVQASSAIIILYCFYSVPSPYFNSLILHFINHRYILNDNEASILSTKLIDNDMETEMELMDRVYPATKLYKLLRTMPTGNNEILKLIRKYKNIGNLKVSEIDTIVKCNDDFIGFSIEIDKLMKMKEELNEKYNTMETREYESNAHLKIPELTNKNTTVKSIKQYNDILVQCLNSIEDNDDINTLEDSIIIENSPNKDIVERNPDFTTPTIIIAPSVSIIDSLIVAKNNQISEQNSQLNESNINDTSCFDIPERVVEDNYENQSIEQSIENISISTTPQKKCKSVNVIDSIIVNLTNEHEERDSVTLLLQLINDQPKMLVASSNIISKVLIKKLIEQYTNIDCRTVLLNTFFKFTQNSEICNSLTYETLSYINSTLIPIVKDNNLIADILINLCLNSDLQILRVYFDMLNNTDEILLKLIWRHSKRVNYSAHDSVAIVISIVDALYFSKKDFLESSENIVLKVCLLHLKECVSTFSDNIKEFGIGSITQAIVDLLIHSKDLNLEDVRSIFRK